jgi:hypothetical protein
VETFYRRLQGQSGGRDHGRAQSWSQGWSDAALVPIIAGLILISASRLSTAPA